MTDVDKNGYTALHGAVHRGGSIPIIRLLAEKGARLDARNNKGWMPLTIAEGVEYTPDIFKRYPETAEALRQMMTRARAPGPGAGPGRVAHRALPRPSSKYVVSAFDGNRLI